MRTLRFKLAYLRRWLRFYLGATLVGLVTSFVAPAAQEEKP